MATIVTDTMTEEAQGWQLDQIIRLLDERRVSGRVAARILAMLDEQPYVNETMGNQTEVARHLRQWTQTDNSHG
jgi:hypothetical protein